jgi:hypothetical protein
MSTFLLHFSFSNTGSIQLSIFQDGQFTKSVNLNATISDLQKRSQAIFRSLLEAYEINARTGNNKTVSNNTINSLREKSRLLFKTLFDLHATNVHFPEGSTLAITLPTSLQFIPVELLHDHQEFWSLKYPMIRIIPNWGKEQKDPQTAFYGFNPSGDPIILAGREFKDRILSRSFKAAFPAVGEPTMKHGKALTREFFVEMIMNRNIILFTGHGDPDSIPFADGRLNASDIKPMQMKNVHLFLNNSCFSASPEGELLTAFLESGVQTYSGYLSKIPQDAATRFAASFLIFCGKGYEIPRVALEARKTTFEREPGALIWANSVVFGQPEATFSSNGNFAPKTVARKILAVVGKHKIGAVATSVGILAGLAIAGILQTKISEGNITEKLDATDQLLKALNGANVAAIGNPTSPQDFLINAHAYASSADFDRAKENYEKFFSYDLKYIEPHIAYQNLLKETEGIESARRFYSAQAKTGDPFFIYLRLKIEEESNTQRSGLKKLVNDHPNFGPAYADLLIYSVKDTMYTAQHTKSDDEMRLARVSLRASKERLVKALNDGNYLKYYIDKAKARDFGLDSIQKIVLQTQLEELQREEGSTAQSAPRTSEDNTQRVAETESVKSDITVIQHKVPQPSWTKNNIFEDIRPMPAFLRLRDESFLPNNGSPTGTRTYISSQSFTVTAGWFRTNFRVSQETDMSGTRIMTILDSKRNRILSVTITEFQAQTTVIFNVTAVSPEILAATKNVLAEQPVD